MGISKPSFIFRILLIAFFTNVCAGADPAWAGITLTGNAFAAQARFLPLHGGAAVKPTASTMPLARGGTASSGGFFSLAKVRYNGASLRQYARVDAARTATEPQSAGNAGKTLGAYPKPMVFTSAARDADVFESGKTPVRAAIAQSNATHVWPVLDSAFSVTSPFGHRDDPITGEQAFHAGIDIAAATGTPVMATADGIIDKAGKLPRIGNYVKIIHKDGDYSVYGHLASIRLEEGDLVKQGEMIGTVGATGRATGPHLHYSLVMNGAPVDPAKYLTKVLPAKSLASR